VKLNFKKIQSSHSIYSLNQFDLSYVLPTEPEFKPAKKTIILVSIIILGW